MSKIKIEIITSDYYTKLVEYQENIDNNSFGSDVDYEELMSIKEEVKKLSKIQVLNHAYRNMLNRVFGFKKTFFSFKDGDRLFNRNLSSVDPIWTEKLVTKDNSGEFHFADGEAFRKDFIDVIYEYLPNSIFFDKSALTLKEIEKNYTKYFKKYIPKNTSILLLTLNYYFNTSIVNLKTRLDNNDTLCVFEDELCDKDLKFIEELNGQETLKEQVVFIKTFLKKKYTFIDDDKDDSDDSDDDTKSSKSTKKEKSDSDSDSPSKSAKKEKIDTDLNEILKVCLGVTDDTELKKTNIFFDKVEIPGKYVIIHNQLLLKDYFSLNPKLF